MKDVFRIYSNNQKVYVETMGEEYIIIFVLSFFALGFFGTIKSVTIVHFAVDTIICGISLIFA